MTSRLQGRWGKMEKNKLPPLSLYLIRNRKIESSGESELEEGTDSDGHLVITSLRLVSVSTLLPFPLILKCHNLFWISSPPPSDPSDHADSNSWQWHARDKTFSDDPYLLRSFDEGENTRGNSCDNKSVVISRRDLRLLQERFDPLQTRTLRRDWKLRNGGWKNGANGSEITLEDLEIRSENRVGRNDGRWWLWGDDLEDISKKKNSKQRSNL